MSCFVYILFSWSDLRFYKGATFDLIDRMERHNAGREIATKSGAPWVLIWKTEKPSKGEAYILERKLKNLSHDRTIRFIEKYSDGIVNLHELEEVKFKLTASD